MSDTGNITRDLSIGLSQAVKRAAGFTVGVDGRGGYPSSGVFYDSSLVLTADHTVDREEDIEILLADGSKQNSKVAGRDPLRDLVLLELTSKTGNPAERAKAAAEVGQPVLALGRPTEEGIQASLGIVSIANGVYRTRRGIALEGVMRSDAVRFPGFAGGPLVDVDGRLVGVNTFGSSLGTSRTLPVEMSWQIAEKLQTEGSVKSGYLGIRSQQVTLADTSSLGREQSTGLLIVGIEAQSPADAAGLMVGDILVGLDGQALADHEDLIAKLMSGLAGKSVSAECLRAGKREEVPIEVGTLERQYRSRSRGRHRGGCC
jgi:S1-C subfamily serine protease